MSSPDPVPKPAALRRALAIAALLFLGDGVWIAQGVLSMLVALWAVFLGLPVALLARKYAGARVRRLAALGIYLLAAVAVWTWIGTNNGIARERAEGVIAAVKAFRADTGRYPASLDELVPRYLPEVPRAKYTLAFHEFTYRSSGNDAWLYYVALPPFGRPTYAFSSGKWGYLD
ncbi:MAG: hypothetical protein KIS74_15690 [Burkholderiales bacterium]|nr:hypothetical protein [Burkholderiales bacterium]